MEQPWLDKLLCEEVSGLFADEWTLEHQGNEEIYHPKHGSCIRCTYRFVWNPNLSAQQQQLPLAFGNNITRLIENAAKGSKADLVSTMTKGKHDFGDWGHTPEGSLMWVFLEVPETGEK